MASGASVATLGHASLAQQIAKACSADPASRDDAVKGADTAAATTFGSACNLAPKGDAFERRFRRGTAWRVQLRGIEVGKAHLDPLVGVRGTADAETVAVADITDQAGELDSSLRGDSRLARICVGGGRAADRDECAYDSDEATAHAAFFKALPPFFFASSARTNLSHLAMPARFSTM